MAKVIFLQPSIANWKRVLAKSLIQIAWDIDQVIAAVVNLDTRASSYAIHLAALNANSARLVDKSYTKN